MSAIPPYNPPPRDPLNPYEVPTPGADQAYDANKRLVPPEAEPAGWQYDRAGAGHGLRSANLSAADPIGMLSSNTIRALIVGIVALGTSFGLKLVVSDAQIDAIVQGVGALVTLGSMAAAWYFRVTATKVVQPGASGTKESAPDVLAKLVAWAMIGSGAGLLLGGGAGCGTIQKITGQPTTAPMSPITRIYVARQAYTSTLDALNQSIEAGFIPASRVPLIRALKSEISTGLDSAEAYARAGDTTNFQFWIARVESALTRYLELTAPIAPATRPTTAPAARALELEPPEVT